MARLMIIMLILTACGDDFIYVNEIEKVMFDLPVRGECVQVADNVWAENEGDHVDIYRNDDCDHLDWPDGLACPNNLHEGEVCKVDDYLFIIYGQYSTIQVERIKL